MTTRALLIGHRAKRGSMVVTPEGLLDVRTYAQLRDALLKCAAEAPEAVVVDLAGLQVERISALSVFPTVWLRTSVWPEVPLLLAGARGALGRTLAASAVPRFVPCLPDIESALEAVGHPPVRRRAEIGLPPLVSSSQLARRWVAEQTTGFGLPDSDAAVLVACELVENALTHTSTGCRLRLERHPAGLSVAVSDDDPRPPHLAEHSPEAPRYGLALVEALSRAWVHSPRLGGGKVVWAVLPLPGGPSGPIGPPGPINSGRSGWAE
jgi:hypothetical protein